MGTRKGILLFFGALTIAAALGLLLRRARTPLQRAEGLYFQRKYARAEAALEALLETRLSTAERCKAELLLGRVHLAQPRYDVVHESLSRLGGLWERRSVVRRNYRDALEHFLLADSLATRMTPADTLLAKRVAFWAGKTAYFLGLWETARRTLVNYDSAAVAYLDIGPYVRSPSVELSERTSVLSGRVVHQGRPVAGVHVILVRTQKGGYASVVAGLVDRLEDWLSMRKLRHPGRPPNILVTGDLWYHAAADEEGLFSISNLQAGSYEWEVIYDASVFGSVNGDFTAAKNFPKVEAPQDSSVQIRLGDLVMCEQIRVLDPPRDALVWQRPVVLSWQWRTYPAQTPFKVKVRLSGMMSTGAALDVLDSTVTTFPATGDTIRGTLSVDLEPGNYLWEVSVGTQADTLIGSRKSSFSLRGSDWPELTAKENNAARAALRDAQKALLQKPLTRTAHLQRCAEKYPHTTWAPNALYNIAYAYVRAREPNKAIEWLEKVMGSYPDTQQARWAQKALMRIRKGNLDIQLL